MRDTEQATETSFMVSSTEDEPIYRRRESFRLSEIQELKLMDLEVKRYV